VTKWLKLLTVLVLVSVIMILFLTVIIQQSIAASVDYKPRILAFGFAIAFLVLAVGWRKMNKIARGGLLEALLFQEW